MPTQIQSKTFDQLAEYIKAPRPDREKMELNLAASLASQASHAEKKITARQGLRSQQLRLEELSDLLERMLSASGKVEIHSDALTAVNIVCDDLREIDYKNLDVDHVEKLQKDINELNSQLKTFVENLKAESF